MARWKALPGGLDLEVVEFVTQLRRLKDGSELSLRDIAAGTHYSTSSWERYLGGRSLPPRAAVQALAALAEADPVRLLARYEIARETWLRRRPDASDTMDGAADGESNGEGTAGSEPSASVADEPSVGVTAGPVSGRRDGKLLQFAVTAVVSAAMGAAATALVLRPGPAAHPASAVVHPVPYACTFVQRDGQWYAGNSATRTDRLEVDMSGPAVAELQCLLQRAGISPGGVDGNFGPLTEEAVIQAQKVYHLDVDGQVGPATWAALRR